jgi:hypothetical protein
MNDLSNILEQSAELMNQPAVKGAVSTFFSWLSEKLFSKNKSTQEKIALIQQQKADSETIAGLKANIEFVLENNEELRKELDEKVKALDLLLKTNNTQTIKTNTIKNVGNNNIFNQDINNSKINNNSL